MIDPNCVFLSSDLLSACKADSDCNRMLVTESELTIFAPTMNAMGAFNTLPTERKVSPGSERIKWLIPIGKLIHFQQKIC